MFCVRSTGRAVVLLC